MRKGTPLILIVDDDPSVCASLALLLKQAGYATHSAGDAEAALAALAAKPIALVLQDMNFSRRTSGEEGLALLSTLKQRHPAVPVILMTAWGSIALAVEGMRKGAADFITKPWTHEQILNAVGTVLGLAKANGAKPGAITRKDLDERYRFPDLVGEDPHFLEILELIGRVAATDAPVLITGESGTGKEGVAEVLHENSPRVKRPFVKVNLGGLSVSLFEAEMFGHTKGAFTDARSAREGRFSKADGGTIFLDEIGDLEASCQVKLLRVLQDRTFEPLGSSTPVHTDVRIVSATNRPLADMVASGEFREDLLYRLNLIAVHLPALRDRRDDIPLLADHFLTRLGRLYRRPDLRITDDGLDWLRRQSWPGNIRQLKQMVERAVLMSAEHVLNRAHFETALQMQPREKKAVDFQGKTLDEVERTVIEQAIMRHDHNISHAADELGLSRAALYRRLEKYGIQT